KPDLQLAIAAALDYRGRRTQALLHLLQLEHALAARPETALLVLGKLLASQSAKIGPHLPPIPDLLKGQRVPRNEFTLLLAQRIPVGRHPSVAFFHPPRKEVTHESGFRGLMPLIVKTPTHSVRS